MLFLKNLAFFKSSGPPDLFVPFKTNQRPTVFSSDSNFKKHSPLTVMPSILVLSVAMLNVVAPATTFSMTTFSITTLSTKVLFVTVSINNIQHKTPSIPKVLLAVFKLSVAIFLLLC